MSIRTCGVGDDGGVSDGGVGDDGEVLMTAVLVMTVRC
jgi:hypothetical protein